jgi:hypothetical protein
MAQIQNYTTGLGVAAYVQVSGTGVTSAGAPGGLTGQGLGAVPSSGHPNAQYSLRLSVGATAGLAATCQLTGSVVDVSNTAVTGPTGGFLFHSYNNPSNGSPSWYKPNPFSSTEPSISYNADVASVSSSGLVTALHPGQAIVEVQAPTFGNGITGPTGPTGPDSEENIPEMVFAQIIVQVQP